MMEDYQIYNQIGQLYLSNPILKNVNKGLLYSVLWDYLSDLYEIEQSEFDKQFERFYNS